MPLSKLFLIYCTIYFQSCQQIMCLIYEVLGRKKMFILSAGYMQETITYVLMYIIPFNVYKPMR